MVEVVYGDVFITSWLPTTHLNSWSVRIQLKVSILVAVIQQHIHMMWHGGAPKCSTEIDSFANNHEEEATVKKMCVISKETSL